VLTIRKRGERMELSDRKRAILQAIIEDYISTAEPVGSRNIAKNHDLGLSAATIRNEMADLEEMGYLDKPHTSAGRIPSEMGYRFYVDSLMHRYSLTMDEISSLQRSMDRKYSQLENVISEISDIISKVTNYPAIVELPAAQKSRLRNVRMMLIEKGSVLIVVVTDAGVVRNRHINVSDNIDYEVIDSISEFLSTQLTGLAADDFTAARLMLIYEAMAQYGEFLKVVIEFVLECLGNSENRVYIGGASNILNNPEFENIDRAREFLSFIDRRENVSNMLRLSGEGEDESISIKIGSETGVEAMRDTSLVVASYSVGDKLHGKIGIIGPKRMDYARVVSSLELINGKLSEILGRMLYGEDRKDDKNGF